MGFVATAIFYLLIGAGVAVAVFLSDERPRGALARGARGLMAAAFWPLFVPILLARPARDVLERGTPEEAPRDEMAEAIARVDAELEAALSGLDGWAEDVLRRETNRLRDLRAAWTLQADRIREMDRLLAPASIAAPVAPANGRCERSEQARRANLERLRGVRQRAYDDLMGTLAWVRELVSMILLARFTGAPASRAEELVAQIAAAVEGISAVTWREPEAAETHSPPFKTPMQTPGELLPCDSSSASATSSPRT